MKINSLLIRIIISIILYVTSFFIKDNNTLYLLCLILSYLCVCFEMYKECFKHILKKDFFDENLLMVLATLGAFFIGEYEEAVIVMLLFQIGEYLSNLAITRSKESIIKMMDLRSDFANVERVKKIEKVKANKVKVGDIIIVKPTEKVPLDGIVVKGESYMDTSSLTGESMPKYVTLKDEVLSGYINQSGLLEVKVTKEFKDSTASRIIKLIEESNDKKTKTEKFITKFCKVYTPVVVLLAILITLIPTVLGYDFHTYLYRSLVFLVISCPCALVISVPLGFFLGIGRASREGIIIKGSNELDNLTNIKTIVLDKTGTITSGKAEVSKINSKTLSEEKLLELASLAEYYSLHPIGQAIVKKYNKPIEEKRISNFKDIPGKGIKVFVDKKEMILGKREFLESEGVRVDKETSTGTVIYIAIENNYIGNIVIEDKIKDEAKSFVKDIKKVGVENVLMLSGDNADVTEHVARKVGIDNFQGNLLPIDKINEVKKIKKNSFTAFVGDGVNDAPVIKISDIGIAMGKIGSDATIEASDIVLIKDNLENIVKAIKISRLTKTIIKYNIAFALIIKIIVLLLGALGYTSIWAAVFSDVGVTLISILNTFIILKKKIK